MQLWHEIHYQRVMEKHHTDFLTPLQKFRCRKRYHGVGKWKFFFSAVVSRCRGCFCISGWLLLGARFFLAL